MGNEDFIINGKVVKWQRCDTIFYGRLESAKLRIKSAYDSIPANEKGANWCSMPIENFSKEELIMLINILIKWPAPLTK